jgi:tetratricopeptide (TPR) repeat protein
MYASSRRTARRADAEALTAAASTFAAAGELDSAAAAAAPALVGDQNSAVEAYNRAITLGATTSDAYFNRGLAHQSLGDDRQAVSDFQSVLAANPDAQTREAATARLRQLGVIDTTAQQQIPATAVRRVYIQFTDEADRAIVDAVAKELVGAGWKVPPLENRDGTTRGDVRAFREADLPLADELGDMVENVLAGQGYRLRLQRMHVKSPREVPAGQLEIWLPRLTTPVRSSTRYPDGK